MTDEKCCCNCLHCARWQTSEGVKCHCDLTDRYLSYLDVMDTDNNCCSWEKETKWDIQKEHDMEIYNKAIDDFKHKIELKYMGVHPDELYEKYYPREIVEIVKEIAEQLKEKK